MALTSLTPINGKFKNGVAHSGVIPITGDLAAGVDTTIFTPANPKNFISVVHITYTKTLLAHTLSFKSGSLNILTLDMPANSGITHALGNGIYFVTQRGEPLVLNCSINLPSILMYVIETESFEI